VEYWKCVLDELKEPLSNCPSELVEGFWPKYNWTMARDEVLSEGLMVTPLDIISEEEALEPYCNPTNEAPQESFNPWTHICSRSWVLLRPIDPNIYIVW